MGNDNKEKRRGGLVKRLQELGMSQEEFARSVGVSLNTAHRWIAGKQRPKLEPAETLKLCTVLKWSLEELVLNGFPVMADDAAMKRAE